MSRRRNKRKRARKEGGGRRKPTTLGPDRVPSEAPKDALAGSTPPVPEPAEEVVQVTHQRSIEVSSGPLPPPSFFRAYEDTLPGAAHRILTMAEKQQGHRHVQQSVRLASDASREARGQWMAFAIVMVALVGGFSLVMFGRSIEGVATALGAIGGIVGLFMRSRRKRSTAEPPGSQDPREGQIVPAPPRPPPAEQ